MHRAQPTSSITGPSKNLTDCYIINNGEMEEGTGFGGGTRGLVMGTNRALAETE